MTSGPRSPSRAEFPVEPRGSLPTQLTGIRSPIVWGVILLVTIEGTLLGLFAVSYYYLRMGIPEWPPPGVGPPDLFLPAVGQVLLLASPVPLWVALRSVTRGRTRPLLLAIPTGLLLAGGYLVLKIVEYRGRDYLWTSHSYGSLDWTMSGYAGLHVVVVLLAGLVFWALASRGHFGPHRYTGIQALLIYWVFVVLGSLLFFGVQYVTPHL